MKKQVQAIQATVNHILEPMLDKLRGHDGALYVSRKDEEELTSACKAALDRKWPGRYSVELTMEGESTMSFVLRRRQGAA